MFKGWVECKRLEEKNKDLVEQNNDLAIANSQLKDMLNKRIVGEYNKIVDLLKDFESSEKLYSSLSISVDGTTGFLPTFMDGTIISTQDIPSFKTQLTDIINNLNVEDRKKLYDKIKDNVLEFIKDEQIARNWNICFKDIIRVEKLNLRRKAK